jgi:hypothetical protein
MEDRRDQRHGMIVNARYRTGSGMPMDVVLHDLSKSGCRIHDRLGRLRVDQFLTIRIGPIGPIDAHVRWLDERVAGIEFDLPLNEAVLEHIRSIAEPAPNQAAEGGSEQRAACQRDLVPLPLTDRARRYADAVGALEIDPQGRETLVGLNRQESEWLVSWRDQKVFERRERPTHREDILIAEQLEEIHELRRRSQHKF